MFYNIYYTVYIMVDSDSCVSITDINIMNSHENYQGEDTEEESSESEAEEVEAVADRSARKENSTVHAHDDDEKESSGDEDDDDVSNGNNEDDEEASRFQWPKMNGTTIKYKDGPKTTYSFLQDDNQMDFVFAKHVLDIKPFLAKRGKVDKT